MNDPTMCYCTGFANRRVVWPGVNRGVDFMGFLFGTLKRCVLIQLFFFKATKKKLSPQTEWHNRNFNRKLLPQRHNTKNYNTKCLLDGVHYVEYMILWETMIGLHDSIEHKVDTERTS